MANTMRNRCLAAVCVAFTMAATDATAQNSGGTPNALQGFSQNRNQPIKIESNSLEVRDKDKVATFIDNVKLTQGDTILETKRLIVFYDEEPSAKPASAQRGPAMAGGGGQNIRRLEAKGGVIVTQRDQTAVGDEGIYDMKTNSVTLTGKVVVTQGQNVITGEKLWVDLATGNSRVDSTGRVQGIFSPASAPQSPSQTGSTPRGNGQSGAPANRRPSQSPPPAPKPPAASSERTRPPSNQPLRLN